MARLRKFMNGTRKWTQKRRRTGSLQNPWPLHEWPGVRPTTSRRTCRDCAPARPCRYPRPQAVHRPNGKGHWPHGMQRWLAPSPFRYLGAGSARYRPATLISTLTSPYGSAASAGCKVIVDCTGTTDGAALRGGKSRRWTAAEEGKEQHFVSCGESPGSWTALQHPLLHNVR